MQIMAHNESNFVYFDRSVAMSDRVRSGTGASHDSVRRLKQHAIYFFMAKLLQSELSSPLLAAHRARPTTPVAKDNARRPTAPGLMEGMMRGFAPVLAA